MICKKQNTFGQKRSVYKQMDNVILTIAFCGFVNREWSMQWVVLQPLHCRALFRSLIVKHSRAPFCHPSRGPARTCSSRSMSLFIKELSNVSFDLFCGIVYCVIIGQLQSLAMTFSQIVHLKNILRYWHLLKGVFDSPNIDCQTKLATTGCLQVLESFSF